MEYIYFTSKTMPSLDDEPRIRHGWEAEESLPHI